MRSCGGQVSTAGRNVWAKTGQHWWGTPADRPLVSPRRLHTSDPHHGERRGPGRAVWRGAAPSSGTPTGYIWAKTGQHWWGTPADRPLVSPRRLRTSHPHHGERREPGRAVWRGAAPGSGVPGASSASRSEGPDWLAFESTSDRRTTEISSDRTTNNNNSLFRSENHHLFRSTTSTSSDRRTKQKIKKF